MLTLDPQLMELGFPANMTFTQDVSYLAADSSIVLPVEFYADVIKVPVKHLSRSTIASILFSSILFLSIIIYITRCFRTFMKMVVDGEIFHSKSIHTLRKAAFGLVALELLGIITEVVGHFVVKNTFDLGEISNSMAISFPSTAVILALALWVLSHIFSKGKEMEDEQKLTV